MTQEETLESWQTPQGIENVIGATTSDPVVLETECLQVCLVAEHMREVSHSVVIQVIIVQEELLEACVVHEGGCNGLESLIADQVRLKCESCQALELLEADSCDFTGTSDADDVV